MEPLKEGLVNYEGLTVGGQPEIRTLSVSETRQSLPDAVLPKL